MRKIQTQDVFKMARIIKTANLKETLIDYIKKGKQISEGKSQQEIEASKEEIEARKEELGLNAFMDVVEACADAKLEAQLYDFLGGLFEMDVKEVKELSLESMVDHLKQMARENDLAIFFKRAGNLPLR